MRFVTKQFILCISLLLPYIWYTYFETMSMPSPTLVTVTIISDEPQVTILPNTGSITSSPIQTSALSESKPLNPNRWQDWPVIPAVSDKIIEVYQYGQYLGNNPQAFSKIGDGQISTDWFFTNFDLGYYDLGNYLKLSQVISEFSGSFKHRSQAAQSGFTTTLILDPLVADKKACFLGETPLECELRLHKPSFSFISLGTNQVWQPEVFEFELRLIIEQLLFQGVIPILSTKADNLESDHRINLIIAELSVEYSLPLWNFWQTVQHLPQHGLQTDGEHLTYATPNFSDPDNMRTAWAWRNLTALQVLDAVWRGVNP